MVDRAGLADFLRHRRNMLQPEDVGVIRGERRRTKGLRREEVAFVCHMSTGYYSTLECGRGPQPSVRMIASMAQGLRLTLDERDRLFRLAGHHPPARGATSEHINPALLRVLDRLHDTPAEIVTELGETLRQTGPGVALAGDSTRFSGPSRSIVHRWFSDPATRLRYAPEDHPILSRRFAADLRGIVTMRGPDSEAAHLAGLLLKRCEEFRASWESQPIDTPSDDLKRFVHPLVGTLELHCQSLLDVSQSHMLVVYMAIPGTESYEKLQFLNVIGAQNISVSDP